MALVFLGLGTNLGDRKANLNFAVQQIGMETGEILNKSLFYQSQPWGFVSENYFLNCVVLISTGLTPVDLLQELKKIEKEMGREKNTDGYSDRIIDIDILLYDNRIIHLPNLIVPHKHLHKRDFVLMPMVEIAPELVHPTLGISIKKLSEMIENNTILLRDDDE